MNGALMASGSSNDYELNGSQSEVVFKFDLLKDDLVTVKFI